jgi:hypothetical protein
MALRPSAPYLQGKQGEKIRRRKMAAWIVLVTFVPIAMIESVWSDFQSVQETIENRKLDASNLALPGDYHALHDEARAE